MNRVARKCFLMAIVDGDGRAENDGDTMCLGFIIISRLSNGYYSSDECMSAYLTNDYPPIPIRMALGVVGVLHPKHSSVRFWIAA